MTPVNSTHAPANATSAITRYEFALVALGVVLAATLAYFNLARLAADTDMFWHIANGREMAQTHSVPQVDNLSWYGAERHLKTSTHEWLFDYALYEVFALGGFKLVYAATALLFGALFGLVFALAWIRSRHFITSLGVAVLSIIGVGQVVAPRPQAVSFVLLVGIALLLERRRWLAVLPLMLLAANVHGGTYPLFLLVIAYYAWREKPWLVAAAAACVVVNPQGLTLLALPFQGLTDPSGGKYIQEFQPPTLSQNWPLFATLGALALLLRNRTMPLVTGLFTLALVGMSLLGARYGAYVFLIALPLVAPHLPFARPRALAPVDGAPGPAGARTPPRWIQAVLLGELAIAVVVMLLVDVGATVDVHKRYPANAARYIESHRIERIFHAYDDGGYLLYLGIPSLIDGRAIQFGPIMNENENLFLEYVRVLLLRDDYRPFMDRLGIEYLLLPKNGALYRALTYDQTITTVYEDATYVIMRRDFAR